MRSLSWIWSYIIVTYGGDLRDIVLGMSRCGALICGKMIEFLEGEGNSLRKIYQQWLKDTWYYSRVV